MVKKKNKKLKKKVKKLKKELEMCKAAKLRMVMEPMLYRLKRLREYPHY